MFALATGTVYSNQQYHIVSSNVPISTNPNDYKVYWSYTVGQTRMGVLEKNGKILRFSNPDLVTAPYYVVHNTNFHKRSTGKFDRVSYKNFLVVSTGEFDLDYPCGLSTGDLYGNVPTGSFFGFTRMYDSNTKRVWHRVKITCFGTINFNYIFVDSNPGLPCGIS